MMSPEPRGASCTPDTMADHYVAVAKEMDVMIVTNVYYSLTDADMERLAGFFESLGLR